MSGSPNTVECQVCGESFDPDASAGWCTNPECGEWQYEADDGGGGGGGDEDEVECPDCGSMVPDKDFCLECGTDLPDQAAAESGSTSGLETGGESGSTDEPACPDCGSDIQEGWEACPQCGADLTADDEPEPEPASGPECPSCGSDVEEGWEACPQCGGNLGSGGGGGTSQLQEVVVKVGDLEITATDGETIGKKVRSAYVRSGADEDEAQYIHREHVQFEQQGADFYVVNKGRNGTKLNGDELDMDERRELQDGDTLKFSDRATGEVSLR